MKRINLYNFDKSYNGNEQSRTEIQTRLRLVNANLDVRRPLVQLFKPQYIHFTRFSKTRKQRRKVQIVWGKKVDILDQINLVPGAGDCGMPNQRHENFFPRDFKFVYFPFVVKGVWNCALRCACSMHPRVCLEEDKK